MPEATRLLRQRQLRGDLDMVLCKALAREADHRYASPRTFADDLQRWMRAEPILARAPSLPYRFGKFARRNRVLVGASGLVAALLVVAIAGIVRERNAALEQARRAETVRDFLAQVFLSTEPTKGEIPDAIEILNEGSRRARDELLQSDPRTAADVLIITGMARRWMSDTARSRDDLETALAALVALPTPPARELMRVHWQLASLYKVIGPLDKALEHGRLAVDWAQRWAAPAARTHRNVDDICINRQHIG